MFRAIGAALTLYALRKSFTYENDENSQLTQTLIRRDIQAQTKCLLLSCMDYRFIQSTADLLERLEYEKAYDYFILAGASLGYNAGPQDWRQTWLDHIHLAKQLHNIQEIIIVEHEDCGYYKQYYGTNDTFGMHLYNVRQFVPQMKALYPDLIFSAYLITLDGRTVPLLRNV
jgi:carbonic anhydrase